MTFIISILAVLGFMSVIFVVGQFLDHIFNYVPNRIKQLETKVDILWDIPKFVPGKKEKN